MSRKSLNKVMYNLMCKVVVYILARVPTLQDCPEMGCAMPQA